MNNKFIKTTAAIMAAVSVCAFAGCGNKEAATTGNGSATEATDKKDNKANTKAVAKVNDTEITAEDFSYYVFVASQMKIRELYPEFTGDMKTVDFKKKMEDGKTLEESILETAIQKAIDAIVLMEKGIANGFVWGEAEDKNITDQVDSFLQSGGEAQFLEMAKSMGIKSVESYKKLYRQSMISEGVLKDISENKDKYIKDAEELKKHKSTKGATAQHVLINKESTKTDNPEALAKEVCEKAKKGEDFAALITQYNEDPGATPAGYTFGPGEMVKEFQDAAFALDIDGISDVVKTDYGFHVIKRLLGGYEVLAKWTEECKIEKNDSAIKKTDVSGIVTEGIEAQKKIQAAQAQAQAAQQQVESGAAQAGQPAAQPAAQPAGE